LKPFVAFSGGRLFPVYRPTSHSFSRDFYEDYALHLNKRPGVGTANLIYAKKKKKESAYIMPSKCLLLGRN